MHEELAAIVQPDWNKSDISYFKTSARTGSYSIHLLCV